MSSPTIGLLLLRRPITRRFPYLLVDFRFPYLSFDRFHQSLRSALGDQLSTFDLSLHPTIQRILLEPPSIAELKSRDTLFAQVLIERVRRNTQILGRLT